MSCSVMGLFTSLPLSVRQLNPERLKCCSEVLWGMLPWPSDTSNQCIYLYKRWSRGVSAEPPVVLYEVCIWLSTWPSDVALNQLLEGMKVSASSACSSNAFAEDYCSCSMSKISLTCKIFIYSCSCISANAERSAQHLTFYIARISNVDLAEGCRHINLVAKKLEASKST